jgi:aryl-alcohol dehydrogenase-like predicted oxidoreductase
VSSATLRRAYKIAPVAAIQTDYSLFALDIESQAGTDLLATCRELGVAIVAAMPLGRGMLTTTFASGEALSDSKDMRPRVMPRFLEGNREKNEKVIHELIALSGKKGYTLPQLAIAWLLKQGEDIIPIPGSKSIKHLEDNWSALDVKLTDQDVAEIREFVESAEIAGETLPDQFKGYNFRDTAEES